MNMAVGRRSHKGKSARNYGDLNNEDSRSEVMFRVKRVRSCMTKRDRRC